MTEWLHFHFSLSSIGEGNGNPLQWSCLENPRDRGAWWAAVYGVAQSWTRLKRLSSSSSSSSAFRIPGCLRTSVETFGILLSPTVYYGLTRWYRTCLPMQETVRDASSIPGSGRSPGGENGNPLQYSCLESSMDGGAWTATVHRVTKSWTPLKQLSRHALSMGEKTRLEKVKAT